MQIGIAAKKVGLSVDAIRFYERNALLRRAPRTEGGFREYGEDDLETLGFIRRAQIQQTSNLAELESQTLVDVRQKLANLQKLEGELRLA